MLLVTEGWLQFPTIDDRLYEAFEADSVKLNRRTLLVVVLFCETSKFH